MDSCINFSSPPRSTETFRPSSFSIVLMCKFSARYAAVANKKFSYNIVLCARGKKKTKTKTNQNPPCLVHRHSTTFCLSTGALYVTDLPTGERDRRPLLYVYSKRLLLDTRDLRNARMNRPFFIRFTKHGRYTVGRRNVAGPFQFSFSSIRRNRKSVYDDWNFLEFHFHP